ncbi:MAG: thioesterase family protein [Acidimicrobiales bacterium]
MTLTAGLTNTASYTVTDDMSPPHLPMKVLSTPHMIQLIEGTCLMLAQNHLADDQTTVGTHVCVSHAAAAHSGEEVKVDCELIEVDRRRLEFRTSVTKGDTVVSEGTHQRFIVGR